MDIHIEELSSTVEAVDGNSLLTPATMQVIVAAVMQALRNQSARERTLQENLDTRSITEQQRAARGQ